MNEPILVAFAEMAENVSLDPPEAPMIVADYGSSQGGNSLEPMARALRVLRRRVRPDRPIQIVHNDVPANDFNSLFQLLRDHPESYLRGDDNLFASAVGASFYGPVLPPQSVTLGWSSNSVHWVSKPMPRPRDSWSYSRTEDAERRAMAQALADDDWRNFLQSRGREIRRAVSLS